jgi:hypothetical protein
LGVFGIQGLYSVFAFSTIFRAFSKFPIFPQIEKLQFNSIFGISVFIWVSHFKVSSLDFEFETPHNSLAAVVCVETVVWFPGKIAIRHFQILTRQFAKPIKNQLKLILKFKVH